MKRIYLLIALVFLVTNAYAVMTPEAPNVKLAENNSNDNRDHIDIIVRHLPDEREQQYSICFGDDVMASTPSLVVASEGAIVIWSSADSAIIGRDITMTQVSSSSLIAGIVSEPNGIASGSHGKIRIYGYFDDALIADSTYPTNSGDTLVTSPLLGQAMGDKNSIPNAGITLGDGTGVDLDEVPVMVNVQE